MGKTSTLKKVVISSTFATGIVLVTPHISEAALGDQTLRQGMTHQDVTELQDVLKAKGYFNLEQTTNFYGSITAEAVREFQRRNNLQVDGIAGPQTFAALVATSNTSTAQMPPTTQAPSTTTLLRFGSSGQAVEALQMSLKDKGYYTFTITGQFGEQTRTAVREFQRANNLQVDGIAGPQTFAAINKANTPSSPAPQPANTVQQPAANSSTLLRVGSSGAQVTDLQAKLRSVGMFDREPTGYYGEETANSVRSFQRLHNLVVDGIAGPNTLQKLNSVSTNQGSGSASNASGSGNTAQPAPANNGAFVTNLVAEAANHIGVPYLWGGTSPSGFDCSGFINYVFNKQGVSIPRTVATQWNAGKPVSQPNVGDLVFFQTISNGPSHNGIYIGNNQFVHSGSSTGVTVASMNNSYWSQRYLGAKRLY